MVRIPREDLNPVAVAKANARLWASHKELGGRQLAMGRKDLHYRKDWMREYQAALKETEPPPPQETPEPAPDPPILLGQMEEYDPETGTWVPVESCSGVGCLTHEEKMEEAINRAELSPAVREALGDIPTLVASAAVAGGILIGLALTGYGAVAEGIAAGLLLLGAALSGAQIGQGINGMVDFYQQSRCDRARTPEDLDRAGKSFADGVANMGVGGLNLLLSVVGARGRGVTGKPLGAKPPGPARPPTPRPAEPAPPAAAPAEPVPRPSLIEEYPPDKMFKVVDDEGNVVGEIPYKDIPYGAFIYGDKVPQSTMEVFGGAMNDIVGLEVK
jgi:hypothetical protein